MKTKIILLAGIVIAIFLLAQAVVSAEESAGAAANEEAIMVLSTNTIAEMRYARKVIEEHGGKIISIFPPSVFIGKIPSNISEELKKSDIIEKISYENVDAYHFKDYESSTIDAINLWNKSLEEIAKPVEEKTGEEKYKKPFTDDLIIPRGLSKTKDEKIKKDKEYSERWKQKKAQLQRNEGSKKQEWQKKRVRKKTAGGSSLFMYAPSAESMSSAGTTSAAVSNFGAAYGAGYYDTSLYMAGDIAVGVFFAPGTAGNWTTAEIDAMFTSVRTALSQFINDEPNARVTFTYIKEVDEGWNPKPIPLDEEEYVNDLRNTYNTHWAYMIVVYKGSGRANANLFGPSIRLYSYDLRDGYALRHETMHIFGAMDQYHPDAARSPIDRWGYLNVVNANSQYNNDKGYFGGAGEGAPDIMISGSGIMNSIGVYSRGQIGWRDSAGNGLLDPLNTVPGIDALNKTGTNQLTYTGTAQDKPLIDEFGIPCGDVTLNTITGVDYRINKGTWLETEAQDGAFDSAKENFTFTTPPLKNGKYIVEVKAVNSIGNTEASYAEDVITITDSPITNAPPFASFIITPAEGSIDTNFTLDASGCSDIEDNASLLQVRWDFDNDGVWDTLFSGNKIAAYQYMIPGEKTIRLEVRDSGALTHAITKKLNIAFARLPPKAFFKISPTNVYGNDKPAFDAYLDASGSYDTEDNILGLKARWDFENDGVWDTDFQDNLTQEHSYEFVSDILQKTVALDDMAVIICAASNLVYVGTLYEGMFIIDITDRENPAVLGKYKDIDTANMRAIYVKDGLAFIATNKKKILIIDVSDSHLPVLKSTFNTLSSPYPNDICVYGAYAYIAESGGIEIVDISNPSAPVRVNNYQNNSLANPCRLRVYGNYLYVADMGSSSYPYKNASFNIIDISNPIAPQFVSTRSLYSGFASISDMYISERYAYIPIDGLQIFDIQDPQMPQLITKDQTLSAGNKIDIFGNFLFTTAAYDGFRIIDISNPQQPALLKTFDTPGLAYDLRAVDGYLYVADGIGDLRMADVHYPFRYIPLPVSKNWKAKLEIKDSDGNTALATRDVWAITYNNSPSLVDIQFSEGTGFNTVGNCSLPFPARGLFASGNIIYAADDLAGLQIIDAANPRAPVVIGSCDTPGSAENVHIAGNYAYVADNSAGLQIIDISNMQLPILAGSYDTPGIARDVSVRGNYAYVADNNRGLQIINITNPAQPTLEGKYENLPDAVGVALSGSCAYIADFDMKSIHVTDVSNPGAPSQVKQISIAGSPRDIYICDNYLYIAADQAGLIALNITDPANPVYVGSCDTSGNACAVYVSANIAYVADNSSGLQIINVSNPASPILMGSYSTAHNAIGVCASIYGNYIYAAADDLEVVTNQAIPALEATVFANDPDINTTWDGLSEFRWDFNNDGIWDTRYSASNNSVFLPAEHGYTIVCEVKDRFGATSRRSAFLQPPNNPPVLMPVSNKTIEAGKTLSFSVVAMDPDPDTLSFGSEDLPEGAIFPKDIIPQDPITKETLAAFLWTPILGQAGDHAIRLSVSDGSLSDDGCFSITVTSPTVIRGLVTDKNGLPFQDARIYVLKWTYDNFTGTTTIAAQTTSDESGRYSFEQELLPGAYNIRVLYAGLFPETRKQFISQGSNYEIDFLLRESPLLVATIRNSLDQNPVSGVTVQLKNVLTNEIVPGYGKASNEQGEIRVYAEDNVPGGTYNIICSKPGYVQTLTSQNQQVVLKTGVCPLATIYMQEVGINPAKVFGFVKNASGAPIGGAAIDLVHKAKGYKYKAFTGADGHYQLDNLPGDLPGQDYSIVISKLNYISIKQDITLHPGEDRHASFNLPASCIVHGNVTDLVTNKKILSAIIEILSPDGSILITYKYNGSEWYCSKDIPVGAYRFRASSSGYQAQEQAVTFTQTGERKTVNFSLSKTTIAA